LRPHQLKRKGKGNKWKRGRREGRREGGTIDVKMLTLKFLKKTLQNVTNVTRITNVCKR